MLATCILAIESYEMYESLDEKCFHSMYFALDYNVDLLFISFSCLMLANKLQPNRRFDSAAAISSSRNVFPRVEFKVHFSFFLLGENKREKLQLIFFFSFYECTQYVRVRSHVPTI